MTGYKRMGTTAQRVEAEKLRKRLQDAMSETVESELAALRETVEAAELEAVTAAARLQRERLDAARRVSDATMTHREAAEIVRAHALTRNPSWIVEGPLRLAAAEREVAKFSSLHPGQLGRHHRIPSKPSKMAG